jgi:hypothetical protein
MSAIRTPSKAARSAWSVIDRVDVIIPFLRRVAVPLLRISLGIVFAWFGLLKVFEVSPVAEFVSRTVYWVDPQFFVPALGVFGDPGRPAAARADDETHVAAVRLADDRHLPHVLHPAERHLPARQPAPAHGGG